MYSLVIADDEQMMRNGLTHMVPWEKLGFTVRAVFSDGGEVLEYLRQNLPDVLLMDIKMIHVSGLEVASFVFENKLPVQIVLLSGYKDFEYARQAVACKVEQYLLKPISIPKLKELFQAIHEKLDERSVMEDALQFRMDQYRELVDYEREQFILDAVMGTLVSSQELERRLKLIGRPESEQPKGCLLFEAMLQDTPSLQAFINEYGSQELADQFAHVLRSLDERLDFYIVESNSIKIQGVYLEKASLVGDGAQSAGLKAYAGNFTHFEQTVVQLIGTILGMEAQVRAIRLFPSLASLSSCQRDLEFSEAPEDFTHRLREQKKLLATYIAQGNPEPAAALFESFVRQAGIKGIHYAKNQVIHLFSTLFERLGEEITEQLMAEISFVEIAAMTRESALVQWGQVQIGRIAAVRRAGHAGEKDSIIQVKEFVEQNYAKDITLAAAAEKVYLNPVYVSRMFKEQTGQTFTEFLTQTRVRAAIRLLEQGQRYVYEIGGLVGYHNLKYFYKVFKRVAGCTPSEYLAERGGGGGGAPRSYAASGTQ